jgi:hypothetical protein
MQMTIRNLLILPFLASACTAGGSAGSPAASLAPAHATAMRDSVRGFLDAYAADVSAPPVGKNAREAVSPFFAPEIVMSADLAPDEPVLVQTVDSLIPPDEVVTVPGWIKSTRLTWGAMVITPLAPGVATYTAKYTEQVTDTSGTVTDLPGVQHGVVRNGANGWRFVTIQSSHPITMHQRQAALVARMTGAK